jgi:CxxC-x17-CxxC domain-containing protein
MLFIDRALICVECGNEFIFSAAEQEFFHEKNFRSDPRHCKQCKAKRKIRSTTVRFESRVKCADCGAETVVPFKPTNGKPVFCRDCYRRSLQAVQVVAAAV